MTSSDIDRIVGLGEDIEDMGRRIQAADGEPHYSGEKAYRAALDAVRILGVVDGGDRDEAVLLDALRKAYESEARP